MAQQRTLLLLLPVLLAAPISSVSAQCSDAGVCAIGSPDEPAHVVTFTGGVSYGRSSDDDLGFTDVHLGIQAAVTDDFLLTASIPYRTVRGPLGNASGVGDLLLAARMSVWTSHSLALSVEGGFRLASGPVNEGGLPQAYQPGLGTTDGLIGATIAGDRWSASAGYQYAPGRSGNTVNRLRRGDDISLRGSYTVLDDGPVLRGEVIVIHKLERSDGFYVSPSSPSTSYVPGGPGIADTDRTQVNLVGEYTYPFGDDTSISIRGAVALLARPVNVDGLKRNATLQAALSLPIR